MARATRRTLIAGCAAAATFAWLPEARATLVRGLTLSELVRHSDYILLVTALDRVSHYTHLGGRRTLVTDTTVRVEEPLSPQVPSDPELLIRRFGGRVGHVAEVVHGQAELALGETCVAFLVRGEAGACWTTGLAQGHYPLRQALTEPLLRASPRLPTIRDVRGSAVSQLAGQPLRVARGMIAAARVPR